MLRRTALATVGAIGLCVASVAGGAAASAFPDASGPRAGLTATQPPASPYAGYVTAASARPRPAIARMQFAVPNVNCSAVGMGHSMMSVWTGLATPKNAANGYTVQIGVQAKCARPGSPPIYNAWWEMKTGSADIRNIIANAAQVVGGDPDHFPVQAGEPLTAAVSLVAGANSHYILDIQNAAGTTGSLIDVDALSTPPSVAECLVDHGPTGSDLPLAGFKQVIVSSCIAGPLRKNGSYAQGDLAVPPTSALSVHQLWGWGVAKKNMVSAAGTVLATTSNPVPPTNTTAGNFTVTWRAAA